jgi:hypothetical protein
MAAPYKIVRNLMREYDYTGPTLAAELGISVVTLSHRLNGKYPWTSDEMYKFMELTEQPFHRMHEIFPRNGINEPGVKRRKPA